MQADDMAAASSFSVRAAATNSSLQALLDQLTSLKRQAFAHLDQALGVDASASSGADVDYAAILYSSCLTLIDTALRFCVEHSAQLSASDEAARMRAHLEGIRAQTNERLTFLRAKQAASTASPSAPVCAVSAPPRPPEPKAASAPLSHETAAQDQEFIQIGDDILSLNEDDDDYYLIVKEDELNASTPASAATVSAISIESTAPTTTTTTTTNKTTPIATATADRRQPFDLTDSRRATELLRITNGAQFFFIADDGTVSAPSHPTTLTVYAFEADDNDNSTNSLTSSSNNNNNNKNKKLVGFVRVGSWLYPIVPNEYPAMKTSFNAFIFPNERRHIELGGGGDGEATSQATPVGYSFVGIKFASDVPTEHTGFFEDLLANYDSLVYQDSYGGVSDLSEEPKRPFVPLSADAATSCVVRRQPNKDDTTEPTAGSAPAKQAQSKEAKETQEDDTREADDSDKTKDNDGVSGQLSGADQIAKSVLTGAQYMTSGVATGTEYAARFIRSGGGRIRAQMAPAATAGKPTLDPKVQTLVQNVRYGTHVSVRVSSYLVGKLGALAGAAARTVAPHIRDGSTALLARTGLAGDRAAAGACVSSVCTVAGSSLQGFGMVYDSLEQAAKTLGKSITEQTVEIVDHRYGADAAKVTQNGMYSVGNVMLAANNVRSLKVTRTFGKEALKEVVGANSSGTATQQQQHQHQQEQHHSQKAEAKQSKNAT